MSNLEIQNGMELLIVEALKEHLFTSVVKCQYVFLYFCFIYISLKWDCKCIQSPPPIPPIPPTPPIPPGMGIVLDRPEAKHSCMIIFRHYIKLKKFHSYNVGNSS